MKILITGGAGYIGSHVVNAALLSGHEVEVVDDLSTGLSSRIPVKIHQIGLAEPQAKSTLVDVLNRDFDAVIHLAAKKQVGESVNQPELYFRENVGGLNNLLDAVRESKVRKLVFSSSAAAYGMPDVDQVTELEESKPINPYGQTKLIGEWMVTNAQIWGLKSLSLRYFNVAGASSSELKDVAALNLIPIVVNQIKANKTPVVFGDDYQTPDGTCIRDYIHVVDLAQAHLSAVDYLNTKSVPHEVFNVGTGQGSSVFEVLDEIRSVSGINFEHVIAQRRAGDPPRLVADVSKSESQLGFKAKHGLREIVQSSWS